MSGQLAQTLYETFYINAAGYSDRDIAFGSSPRSGRREKVAKPGRCKESDYCRS
jgi:hypothetical protein